ncbi:Uncharacterised protein [uncultured archaeon]|nr:Uncharacterised protein [uncultured archaeon]
MDLKINKEDLEKALKRKDVKPEAKKEEMPQISREEEIGFHKGCLNTLAAERNELFKMIQTVEAIMQAHLKRLEELGVKIQAEK